MKKTLSAVMIGMLFFTCSCGTILYPERRGQEGGKMDIGVVLLDGLGLLIYLVPGLIAFGVDFATGAIYLPPGEDYGDLEAIPEGKIIMADAALTQKNLERILQQETGTKIDLNGKELMVARVSAEGKSEWRPIDQVMNEAQLKAFRSDSEDR